MSGSRVSRLSRAAVRPEVVVIADQAASSATNFLVIVLAARYLGPSGLGAVAVALGVGIAAVVIVRGLVGEPLLVFYSRDVEARAVGAAIILSFPCAAIAIAVGIAVGGATGQALIALGVLLPGVILQDTLRYVHFAVMRPHRALASDAVWGAGMVLGITMVGAAFGMSPVMVVLAWSLGAAIGAGLLLRGHSVHLHRDAVVDWLRTSRGLSPWLGAQTAASQAGMQLTIALVGAVAGLSALGGFRAGQSLTMPFVVLAVSLTTIALPKIRQRSPTGPALPGTVKSVGLVALVAGLAYAAVILLAGDWILPALFGESFSTYDSLVPAIAATVTAIAIAVAPGIGNRAARAGKSVLATQMAGLLVGAPLILLLADSAGAEGAAWGLAGQAACIAVASWVTYYFVLRRRRER